MASPADDQPEIELRLLEEDESSDASLPVESATPEAPAWTTGDEPDRPYDVGDVSAQTSPLASIEAFANAMTLKRDIAPRGESQSQSADGQNLEPMDPLAQRWTPSLARDVITPSLILICATTILFAMVAGYSANFRGARAAGGYVLVTLLIRISVTWLTCLMVARWLDIPLGRVRPALLKLAAIGVAPLGLASLLLPFFSGGEYSTNAGLVDAFTGGSGGVLGAVIGAVISFATMLLLFYLLFELDADQESWWLVTIEWLVQLLAAGLAVHLIVNPIPYTPPYVPPAHPFHFMIGN